MPHGHFCVSVHVLLFSAPSSDVKALYKLFGCLMYDEYLFLYYSIDVCVCTNLKENVFTCVKIYLIGFPLEARPRGNLKELAPGRTH